MAADQALSTLWNRLAPLIEKTVRREVNLLLNAEEEALALSSKLQKIYDVLADAERKAVADRRVENWLRKLQDIAYEIDDALDEWEVENIKQRLDEESEDDVSSSSWEKKVCSFLESVCLCFKQTIRRRSIASEIEKMNQKLDSISKENEDEFDFVPDVGRVRTDFKRNTSTTSFVDVSGVYGRDCDKDSIITKLLAGCEDDHDGVQVVSIIGVGGMGKTTLAQLIFNDCKVQEQFSVKKWICVSEPFDKIKIAKEILGAGNDSSDLSFQRILERIVESMTGKMLLLVLDDVWIEVDEDWRDLKVALTKGAASGSKILVTTRKEKVATTMDRGSIVHPLQPLEDAYCWSIISKIAFNGRAEGNCNMLEETGQKIAKKCKGLSLAAKIIGGVLHSKTSLQEWQHILKSEMHELKDVRNIIFPLLKLSYNELHPTVRLCFSYCAIFPKDANIEVDELIRFWMAQGFLSSTKNAGDMELTGREYLNDLAMRSFFPDFHKDGLAGHIDCCKMHDMVHDYAQSLTNNEYLVLVHDYEYLVLDRDHQGRKKASNTNVRHLNLIMRDALSLEYERFVLEWKEASNTDVCDLNLIMRNAGWLHSIPNYESHLNVIMRDAGWLDSIHNYERLRSFICNNCIIAPNLFAHLKKVRLVRVYGCELENIPEEIGNLIHLRYLDIGGNRNITKLPETICDLCNLQTLSIYGCKGLSELPQKIHKLINLRHLRNYGTEKCKLPKGIEKLINLRTLNALYATSKSGDSRLGLLNNMNQLASSLTISISDEGWDVEEAKKADLKSKVLIDSLWLQLKCNDGMNMEVVEALQPHPNLISLRYWYGVGHLPKWITTLTHLKKLFIAYVQMPSSRNLSIGDLFSHDGKFPSLETLHILQVKIKHVGSDFLSKTFPKLRALHFYYCEKWEEWEDMKGDEDGGNEDASSTNTQQLECLHIEECHKLKALPIRILRAKRLQQLEILRCSCLKGLKDQLAYIGCRDVELNGNKLKIPAFENS